MELGEAQTYSLPGVVGVEACDNLASDARHDRQAHGEFVLGLI